MNKVQVYIFFKSTNFILFQSPMTKIIFFINTNPPKNCEKYMFIRKLCRLPLRRLKRLIFLGKVQGPCARTTNPVNRNGCKATWICARATRRGARASDVSKGLN